MGICRRGRCGSAVILGIGCCLLAVAGALTAAAVFQIIQNHTGHTALLLGLFVLPDILVIPAAQADKGTFLQAHFADAFYECWIEALDGNVDPAVVILSTGIVDLLAYTEAAGCSCKAKNIYISTCFAQAETEGK